jgi:DNA-binding protein HU-beta
MPAEWPCQLAFKDYQDYLLTEGYMNVTTPIVSVKVPVEGLPRTSITLMNKAELVEAVRKVLGKETSRAEAERAVGAVVDGIKAGLRKDKNVQLIGFGTFKVAERAARMGTNPKTRQKIRIKKSKTVKFGAGKELKAKI